MSCLQINEFSNDNILNMGRERMKIIIIIIFFLNWGERDRLGKKCGKRRGSNDDADFGVTVYFYKVNWKVVTDLNFKEFL